MNTPILRITRLAALAGALCAGLAACGVFGPPRDPPPIAAPSQYAARPPAALPPTADGVAQQVEAGARPVPEWWQAYRSPTLSAWVAEGLSNSPSLSAARHQLEAAHQSVRGQIGNSMLPKVDLGVAPSRQRALTIPGLSQETFLYNVFAAELETSYTLDFFGAALLADRSLARQVRGQAYQLETVRRALAANIVVAAINAASLQAQLTVTEELVTLGEQRAAQAAARQRLGGASELERLTAEEDAANAATLLPVLRAQLLAVRHAQAVLMGRSPDQAPDPLALEDLHLPEQVPVAVASELLHQRPDILAAEAAVRATADAAGAAAAALYPSLTLSAAYGRGGFDWSTFASPAGALWSAGATLTQPLLHGGALRARKRQYDAQYAAAVDQYRLTVLGAFQNVADTLVSLEEDANALAQYQRAADAARELALNTEARYRLGATALTSSLTARQESSSAKLHYLGARAARLADTAALFDSMGGPRAE
jgi:NodT family efflux transporter outer membrane factor (OMF) lipoprotein